MCGICGFITKKKITNEALRIMNDTIELSDGLAECYEWYRNNKAMVKRKPLLEYIEENL